MSWEQFVSAFLGALIVKLFDLAAKQYSDRKTRKEEKVNLLIKYTNEFGELTDLYRQTTNVSTKLVLDKSKKPKRTRDGRLLVENTILEPEPQFEDALKMLKGSDINSAIAQKIVSIRLSSSEALDIADELDKTGKLKKSFTDLYIKTVWVIENILKNKNNTKPYESFKQMTDAIGDADEYRRVLRKQIQGFLK